jgi:hypothetical protein
MIGIDDLTLFGEPVYISSQKLLYPTPGTRVAAHAHALTPV